jgi:glycosyltransferase involved in cell wall biosynthesis
MKVTVILCTFNRCRSLPKALESVAASVLPDSVDWEVLVVDNNSKDETRAVVENFIRRYPGRFRYLLESQQGLSRARNAGVAEARGDILAFMDDDVTVEPTWLQNLTRSMLNDSQWAGAGGRIVLQWPIPLPAWLITHGPRARHGFPGFDQGNVPKGLNGPPFGTNMTFRREMFERYGNFRTDLGRCANQLMSNEDTEFGRRLISGGERLRYEPSAVVYHPVPEARINKEHFLEWWFEKGRSDARELATSPLKLFCSFLAWIVRWTVATDPALRFYCKLVVWEKAGTLMEWSRQLLRTKKQKEWDA